MYDVHAYAEETEHPAERAQFALRQAITDVIEAQRADIRASMAAGYRSNRQPSDYARDRLISLLNHELYHLGLCVRRRPHTTWSFPL